VPSGADIRTCMLCADKRIFSSKKQSPGKSIESKTISESAHAIQNKKQWKMKMM